METQSVPIADPAPVCYCPSHSMVAMALPTVSAPTHYPKHIVLEFVTAIL